MNASPFTPLDGQDVDELLRENGALGDWEDGIEDSLETERFLFPRFPGADNGTCKAKGAAHKGEHAEITDGPSQCVDFEISDMGNMYLSRSGIGPYDTDVETLAAWLDAPRTMVGAILLLGEPGTGKTALLEAAVTYSKRQMITVLNTPDHTRDSLFLKFVGEGKGENGTPFALGPLPYAAKHGLVYYSDEHMMLSAGVQPAFYAATDGRRFLPEGNVDGSPLEIHPDFRLVISSNPQVRGASLPEPLASRCAGTTITVETTGSMLRDLGIDESIVAAWEALGAQGAFRPQIRECRVADYWLGIDPDQAASAFLGEHCPESQRETVRNTVLGYIGSNLRGDGRLVVS